MVSIMNTRSYCPNGMADIDKISFDPIVKITQRTIGNSYRQMTETETGEKVRTKVMDSIIELHI